MARTLFLLIVLLGVGAVTLMNWPVFSATAPITLGFTTVQVPLGLTMLGVVVLLTVLFVGWALSLQSSALAEQRRATRELQAQRELADKAELSRFSELRSAMTAELLRVQTAHEDSRRALVQRVDRLEDVWRRGLQDQGNSLAAQIAEFEDRMERSLAALPPVPSPVPPGALSRSPYAHTDSLRGADLKAPPMRPPL